MKWTTWENVAVDRIACAWLIRRWIDPEAEFLFIAPGTTPAPDGSEPFDMPGVRLTHRRGHSTFHTMLREYDLLSDPILQRIARIVDEADVVQASPVEAIAPGLDVLCRGIRRTSPDDYVALERGAQLYEGLYEQLAAEVKQQQETET